MVALAMGGWPRAARGGGHRQHEVAVAGSVTTCHRGGGGDYRRWGDSYGQQAHDVGEGVNSAIPIKTYVLIKILC